ncbi:MAG: sugar kinase [Rhizobiaceae bacterium]|nr:sugar kinase [Rhizobiaceae bacterium]
MTSVACIGECMIELSATVGDNWKLGFAGDTFNAIWALRALLDPTATTDFVTAFGDDTFSEQQISFMREAGIGTASSPILPGARPGLYAITLTGAERSFTYWRSHSAARRLADNPDDLGKSLRNRSMIYFSGITLAVLDEQNRRTLLEAIATARLSGSRIAFDPNYRQRLWPDRFTARNAIGEALAVTDVALPTFPDERDLFDDNSQEATIERFAQVGIPEIIVKNGAEPCLLSHYGETTSIDAISVSAVDTTGAGDAFNGAYLAARLHGLDPAVSARRAHRVAARVVQTYGALAPFEALRTAFES